MKSARERAGNEAHYRDAAYYDHAYRSYRPDVGFYVELARGSESVLELGVGTGRIAMALAEQGTRVVGIDRMPNMLERFRERLAKAPKRVRENVELHEGDLRSVRLEQRFPLVIAPFNVMMHLYERTDVEQALATVLAHLEPDGAFAFDVLMPDLAAMRRDPHRLYKSRPIKHPKDGKRYRYEEAFRYDHARQVQTVSMLFTDLEDEQNAFVIPLAQRQFFPCELDALLHYNGFEVDRYDGGFQGEPVDETTISQVVVAHPRD